MTQGLRIAAISLGLFALPAAVVYRGLAQETESGLKQNGFNQGQARPAEDPVVVAHGKTLYSVSCQACHGVDLRGGDLGGPNLLRSSVAMTDRHGENIVPIIQGGRQAQGMPKIGISVDDSDAVAAYVRSVVGAIGRQGAPPGMAKELNIVVGDEGRGRVYFEAHCASCHSTEGDLRGIGARFSTAKRLQAAWLSGVPLPETGTTATATSSSKVATKPATVTTASGERVSGTLLQLDDFVVTLQLQDGSRRSFRRMDDRPVVEGHDALQAHQAMLPQYKDADVHDVTAYLVTLK